MTMTGTDVNDVGLAPRQIHLVMIALMAGMFLAALDSSILATAQPTIVGELGGQQHIAWVFTAYLLTSTVGTPVLGKLSDLHGRKVVFQTTIVVFIAASILAGLSQSMFQLVMFRGLQGIGAGGLIALPMIVAGDVVAPNERGRYQGYISVTFSLAAVMGPLLGGFIVDHMSWRWVFFINVPIGLMAMAAIQRLLTVKIEPTKRRIDYLGAVLLLGAFSPPLVALSIGGDQFDWGSPQIVGMFLAGAAVFGAFVWWEHRAEEPIVPFRIFRNDIVAITIAVQLLVGGAMFGATVFVPIYLQVVVGLSATQSGLNQVAMFAGITLTSIGSGRLITTTGRYKPFPIIGMGCITVGVTILSMFGIHNSRWDVAGAVFILGLGLGMVMPVLILIVQNAAEYRDIGVVSSTTNFVRSLGSAIGAAAFGAIYASHLTSGIRSNVSADQLATLPDPEVLAGRPDQIRSIADPDVLSGVLQAFTDAVTMCFTVAIPVSFVGFLGMWFVREIPLRTTILDKD